MRCLIAIMSYNRGEFLLNCVSSIERNLQFPYELQIYDDDSNDEYTCEVLNDLKKKYSVYNNDEKKEKHLKVKGLYQNMNKALQYCSINQIDHVLIMQDDMQVIRKVDEIEFSSFTQLPDHAVLVPLFFKMNHQKDYKNLLRLNSNFKLYEPLSVSQRYMNGIADIGLFNVQGLENKNWHFLNDEGENMERGRELGYQRVVLFNPFLAYLPWPKTNRAMYKGIKGYFKRAADAFFQAGFHPFNDLDTDGLRKLTSRDPSIIPFAEDYLLLKENPRLRKPWNYYDSTFPVRKLFSDIKKKLKNAF